MKSGVTEVRKGSVVVVDDSGTAVASKGRLWLDGKRVDIADPKLDWPECAERAADLATEAGIWQ